MKESYKDDETLVEIEEACDWHASVALLEIVADGDCMTRLADLELARALLEDELHEEEPADSTSSNKTMERLVAALGIVVILLLFPGSVGGFVGALSAVGVASVAALVAPRMGLESATVP